MRVKKRDEKTDFFVNNPHRSMSLLKLFKQEYKQDYIKIRTLQRYGKTKEAYNHLNILAFSEMGNPVYFYVVEKNVSRYGYDRTIQYIFQTLTGIKEYHIPKEDVNQVTIKENQKTIKEMELESIKYYFGYNSEGKKAKAKKEIYKHESQNKQYLQTIYRDLKTGRFVSKNKK